MDHQDTSIEPMVSALEALIQRLHAVKQVALRPGAIAKCVMFNQAGAQLDGDMVQNFLFAISQWDVMDDAEHGDVPRFPGLIEASQELIDALAEMNAAKVTLEQSAKLVAASTPKERQKKIRKVLTAQGLMRAHPLQCWREIQIVKGMDLKTVGFTIINKSISTKTYSKDESIRLLYKKEAFDVAKVLEAANCSSVRWVTPVSPFIRANISTKEDGTTRSRSIYASLPIVIEIGSWPKKVKFNLPKSAPVARSKGEAKEELIPLPFRENAYLALS